MSSESKKMKPKTNFDLIPNYSSQYNWKKLNNDTGAGAGANADFRADKTFSATDPLSEIVWSPDKGFSLKCVDSSFINKTTSLFRDAEPSSMVLALLQTVTSRGNSTKDKPINDTSVKPLVALCTKADVSSTEAPARNPTSDSVVIIPECKVNGEHDTGTGDNMERFKSATRTSDFPNGLQENLMNCWEKNICSKANIETTKISKIMENKSFTISGQVDQCPIDNLLLQADESKLSMEHNPSPKKHWKEGMDTDVGNQVVKIENDLYTRVEHMIKDNGTGALGTYVTSSGISHSKKLELIAENDLQAFNCEATLEAKSGFLVSKSNKNKNKKDLPVMHSPCCGRFHMTSGSEQKSLSDGDSSFRLPKDEYGNPLRCENYHNTELFMASRKRCKQEEHEVRIGSKKFKKQIQATSYSKSYVKKDSSFMNLVSNMMKGYSQSSHDEEKPLTLVHENLDCHLLRPDQKLLKCNKDQGPERKNSGFKLSFQSMYCQAFENVGTSICHQVGKASKDFDLGKEVHGIDATPRNFCAENSRQYVQPSRFEVSKEGGWDGVGPTLHSQIRPVNPFTCKVEETREQFADIQLLSEAKTLDSCCIKDEKGNRDDTSKYKFNHVTHFPRLRDSEPMVSMFARRLGAIKQWQQTE